MNKNKKIANVPYIPFYYCYVLTKGEKGVCWRSLSIKFNYQINKEKDPNAINVKS